MMIIVADTTLIFEPGYMEVWPMCTSPPNCPSYQVICHFWHQCILQERRLHAMRLHYPKPRSLVVGPRGICPTLKGLLFATSCIYVLHINASMIPCHVPGDVLHDVVVIGNIFNYIPRGGPLRGSPPSNDLCRIGSRPTAAWCCRITSMVFRYPPLQSLQGHDERTSFFVATRNSVWKFISLRGTCRRVRPSSVIWMVAPQRCAEGVLWLAMCICCFQCEPQGGHHLPSLRIPTQKFMLFCSTLLDLDTYLNISCPTPRSTLCRPTIQTMPMLNV